MFSFRDISIILVSAIALTAISGCATTADSPIAISIRRLSKSEEMTFPRYLRKVQLDNKVASVLTNRNLICGVFLIKNGSSRELIISYLGEPTPQRVRLIRADGNSFEIPINPIRIRPADGVDHEIHLKSEYWEIPDTLGDAPILYAELLGASGRLSRESKVWTFNTRTNQWEVAPPAKLIKNWSESICPPEK